MTTHLWGTQMFNSIKGWMQTSVNVKPYASTNGVGDITYKVVRADMCYVEEKTQVIRDSRNREVVSMTQLFVDGDSLITVLDKIDYNGKYYDVQNISTYYLNGIPDIKVVYL